MTEHIIKFVKEGSIGEELGLEKGDAVISINNVPIEDIFDYQFLINDDYIEVLVKTKDGEECILEIEKDFDEDLGLEFEQGLMDEYHSCHNKCIFCFIDQMPPGMRDTLYFKDDDTRLSFLQGNYVTLTNLSDKDVDRLIKYRLEPINISIQTMNPELRCKMLNNRFAGEALKKIEKLYKAEIIMNGQIVLCKGINDGKELEFSLQKLLDYYPVLQSVSVVPVGLTKYREGLYPLESFTKEDAIKVIDLIEHFQKMAIAKGGTHFCHASDEWYILADREIPGEDSYDGYLQLENGVGMIRSLIEEVNDFIESDEFNKLIKDKKTELNFNKTLATGKLAFSYINMLKEKVIEKVSTILGDAIQDKQLNIISINNDFFGEKITVAGLITGNDLINQLKNLQLGNAVYIPECMLRSGEDVFLDDVTVSDVQTALQVPIRIVKSSGRDFVLSLIDK